MLPKNPSARMKKPQATPKSAISAKPKMAAPSRPKTGGPMPKGMPVKPKTGGPAPKGMPKPSVLPARPAGKPNPAAMRPQTQPAPVKPKVTAPVPQTQPAPVKAKAKETPAVSPMAHAGGLPRF